MDFGQMGDMKKMYDNYQKLQKELAKTIIRAREGGIVVDMTAEMKLKSVRIEDPEILQPDNATNVEEAIQIAFKKAQEKAQQVAMEKTKEILGFDPNQLASMMGGAGGGGMPPAMG